MFPICIEGNPPFIARKQSFFPKVAPKRNRAFSNLALLSNHFKEKQIPLTFLAGKPAIIPHPITKVLGEGG
jgi:hypothetical protein